MSGARASLLALMIFAGTLFIIPSFVPAHGAIPNGTVCVNMVTSTTCPSTPATISAAVGSTFNVAVNIFNSGALNGFAISLHVDPHFLKPINATQDSSIIGYTLPGNQFVVNPTNCANNGANGPPSNVGCSAFDGNGTTTFAVLSVGGLSIPPTTGRLFVASYKVVGLTSNTTIGYVVTGTPTATGTATCTGTSLVNTCITITNGGTGGPTLVNLAEVAFLSNADKTGTAVSCAPLSFTLPGTSTCTATVIDITVAASVPTGTVSFVSSNTAVGTVVTSCGLTAGSCSVTFTGVAAGSATVTGTYGGDATHAGSSGTSTLTVSAPLDRTSTGVACTPTSITAGMTTSSCTATVTDTTTPPAATASPSGTVTFVSSNTAVGTVGASCTLSPSPATSTTVSSCSVTFTGVAVGTATVTGIYGGDRTHNGSTSPASNTITVIVVSDFSVSASPASLTIATGTSGTSTVTVTGINGFSGTVALTNSTVPGVTLTFSPASVTLPPSPATSTLTIALACSVPASTFTITVTGTSGSTIHSTSISVTATTGCPAFIGGKLSWTHHLSLAKNAFTQTFTAKVTNFEAGSEYLQVFITGTSGSASFTCPSSTATAFEMSCASVPVLFTAGSSGTITISLVLTTSDIGLKFHFTAILEFSPTLTSSGALLNPQTSNSKSGAFAVVS